MITILHAPPVAAAITPDELMSDPVQEARARNLFAQFRCPTCTTQSLLDSSAESALDLRLFIRDQIRQGVDDAAIRHSIEERYGPDVFLTPDRRMHPLLWAGPLVIFLIAFGWLAVTFRASQQR